MNKPCLALALCLSLLGGCANVARQAAYPQRYTLGARVQPATPTPATPTHDATLQVTRVVMPAWQRADGVYYRLAYGNRQRVAAYANSEWAAPPADLLEQLIRNALAADGGWRAVVGPGSGVQARYALHVDVADFSQVFGTPQTSFGELDATATLVEVAHARVVAQRAFHLRIPADSADAAGGVAALGTASRDFTRQLQAWLRAQPTGQP